MNWILAILKTNWKAVGASIALVSLVTSAGIYHKFALENRYDSGYEQGIEECNISKLSEALEAQVLENTNQQKRMRLLLDALAEQNIITDDIQGREARVVEIVKEVEIQVAGDCEENLSATSREAYLALQEQMND